MPDSKRLEEAREWLRFAAEDLEAAELLANASTPKVTQALFHAQQAAEKALKAFLVFSGRTYPLTHSLNVLADLCSKLDPTLRQVTGAALWLTQYAVRFRYPGAEEEPGVEDARKGVEAARAVWLAVRGRVSS